MSPLAVLTEFRGLESKASNRSFRSPAPKKPVVALVEHNGEVRSLNIANVIAKQL